MCASFRVTSVCAGSRCVRIPVPSSCSSSSSSSTGEAAENTKTFLCSSRCPPHLPPHHHHPPPTQKKVTVLFFRSFLKPHNNNSLTHPPHSIPPLPAASHCALFPWQQELIWRSCRGRWQSRVFVCTAVCGRAHTQIARTHTLSARSRNDYPYLSPGSVGRDSLRVSICPSVCLYVRVAILKVAIINIFL